MCFGDQMIQIQSLYELFFSKVGT